MSNNFQTIATFWNPNEAQLAKALIEAEGIQVVLMGYEAISTDWLLTNAIGGVQLQVPQDQVKKAAAILEDSGPFGRRSLTESSGERMPQEEEEEEEEEHDSDGLLGTTKGQSKHPTTETIEESIERFANTSVLCWLFFPLSLYAVWQLLCILFRSGEIDAYFKRKFFGAMVICMPPFVFTIWLAARLLLVP